MKKVLIELSTLENGDEKITRYEELIETSIVKTFILDVEEIESKDGHVGEYVWNQEKQELEVKYSPVVSVEELLSTIKTLQNANMTEEERKILNDSVSEISTILAAR